MLTNDKKIKIFLIVTLILLIGMVCILLLSCNSYRSYNQRLKSHIDTKFTYEILYESEAGFGNDEFNICRFSLDKPKIIKGFNSADNLLNKVIENDIKDFFDRELENNDTDFDYNRFYQELSELEKSTETTYLYRKIENDLSYELYIYNREMNIGYYIVSIF